MKILHVLDHSIPLHSGYTFRTRSILKEQHKLGIETCHVTSPKHGNNTEEVEEVDQNLQLIQLLMLQKKITLLR